MSAQHSRPIGIIAFASGLLSLGGVAAPGTAFAADCLTAPSSDTPANGHWYYHTDRTQQRKCWSLKIDGHDSDTQSAPAAANSLASFREFLTQHAGAKLSDQDVEKLYTQFLAWNRAKN